MQNTPDLLEDLFQAILEGQVKTVDNLLDYSPRLVNQCVNDTNITPLMFASIHGRVSIASHLIHRGAELNVASRNRFTSLMWAIENDHPGIVELLLSHKAKLHRNALHQTSALGALQIVQAIIKHVPQALNFPDKHNQTPLFLAARYGHIDTVRYLAEEKDTKLDHAITPPLLSSCYGSVTIRPFVRSLKHQNQADTNLCKRYDEIDQILEHAGAKEFSNPRNILCLLDRLISTIYQHSDFSNVKAKQLETIKAWLEKRIEHTMLNKGNAPMSIVSLITRVCATPRSIWSYIIPNSLPSAILNDLSSWMAWHHPKQNLDAQAFHDENDFLITFKKMQSIISIPSVTSLSTYEGRIFKSISNDEEAISPKSITTNLSPSPS